MKLYVYIVAPIDRFDGMMTAKEAAENAERRSGTCFQVDKNEGYSTLTTLAGRVLAHLGDLFEMAKEASRTLGWEGDVREGPYFFTVPVEGGSAFGVVWKQDNNGTSFIGSPVPLDYLRDQRALVHDCLVIG